MIPTRQNGVASDAPGRFYFVSTIQDDLLMETGKKVPFSTWKQQMGNLSRTNYQGVKQATIHKKGYQEIAISFGRPESNMVN